MVSSLSNLQVTRTIIKSRTSSILGQIWLFALELLALVRWKFFPLTYNGEDVLNMIFPSFFICSSSNLQITRTGIKSRIGSIWGQIGLFALELLALKCRKKPIFDLVIAIAPTVFIESLWNLQITRTSIKSRGNPHGRLVKDANL